MPPSLQEDLLRDLSSAASESKLDSQSWNLQGIRDACGSGDASSFPVDFNFWQSSSSSFSSDFSLDLAFAKSASTLQQHSFQRIPYPQQT